MKRFSLIIAILFLALESFSHPMPGSVVELSVLENSIRGTAKIPFPELVNAIGDERARNISDPELFRYFHNHIQARSGNLQWNTVIKSVRLEAGSDPEVGAFQEVFVSFIITPADISRLRKFVFYYDAVLHQVVTHSAIVVVKEDWTNGINSDDKPLQVGVIALDVPSGKIFPLQISLENGSNWKGFASMVNLGIQHIKEGTDHLLFLLTLLLPSMLLVYHRRWGSYGGLRYSLLRLVKIISAFTIGHSVTLLIGALGWIHLPSKLVEIMIAFSILISAVHALRPMFPGKESMVAGGFGLIHGLAFATILGNLNLGMGKLAISILGFNLGIEIMQLAVMAITIPWLIILSRHPKYNVLRIFGATLAAVAAIGWIIERITDRGENIVTTTVQMVASQFLWVVAALAILAVLFLIRRKETNLIT